MVSKSSQFKHRVMLWLWAPSQCFHYYPIKFRSKQKISVMILKQFLNLHCWIECGFENRNKVRGPTCYVIISTLINFTQLLFSSTHFQPYLPGQHCCNYDLHTLCSNQCLFLLASPFFTWTTSEMSPLADIEGEGADEGKGNI